VSRSDGPAAGALAADYLPHAAPFLLLDRIVTVDDTSGRFTKCVASDDPLLGATGLLSPMLVIEAMAQGAGLVLMRREPELHARGSAVLAAIDRCEVSGAVRSGDVLVVEVNVLRRYGDMARVSGSASVDGVTRLTAALTLAFVRATNPAARA
jgi:3-hydroxyacyl-[acyl-carrier-protein] dehydratase